MDAILNTPIQVLDKILALNLDINIWSARAKLTAEDFGETELPPDELASLGSKKICDPNKLKVFSKLKKRATTMLDRNGVRFLSGWAIPEEKAGDIIAELCRRGGLDGVLQKSVKFLIRHQNHLPIACEASA